MKKTSDKAPPKKRGRKPKNKIVINENPSFEQSGGSDNLIANIQLKSNSEKDIDDIKILACNEGDEYSNSDLNDIETKSDIICWNCCEKSNNFIGYPTKYINGLFHVCGNFCSYECSARYIYDNFYGTEMIDKYNLLNLYYNINHNTIKKIKIAPSRQCLKKFGGKLTYEEYIKNADVEDILNTYISPIVFVNHESIGKPEYKNLSLKMARKTNKNKYNISEEFKDKKI